MAAAVRGASPATKSAAKNSPGSPETPFHHPSPENVADLRSRGVMEVSAVLGGNWPKSGRKPLKIFFKLSDRSNVPLSRRPPRRRQGAKAVFCARLSGPPNWVRRKRRKATPRRGRRPKAAAWAP
ncbi:hypothetical protein Taro_038671 [Colocasia esculenta]|uniref:Uncharacterized protein n=1 Tax=Colocasia esculenta TaxID=4460 RepID=A0A843W443_COLES|nr:hypothetical protein [Colocasia esculenta]